MAWFRRRRIDPVSPDPVATDPDGATDPDAGTSPGSTTLPDGGTDSTTESSTDTGTTGGDLVPIPTGQSLARTARALELLAAQSAQLHGHLLHLEDRVDRLSDALLDRLDVPTHDDVLQARMHAARVAAELSRLEINLAARLDAVRDQLQRVDAAPAGEIDLRVLTPADTGWTPAR